MNLDDVLHRVVGKRTASYASVEQREVYAKVFEAYRRAIEDHLPELLERNAIEELATLLDERALDLNAESLNEAHVRNDLATICAFIKESRDEALARLRTRMATRPLYRPPQPLRSPADEPDKLTPGWGDTMCLVRAVLHEEHGDDHQVVFTTDDWATEATFEGEVAQGSVAIEAPIPSLVGFATVGTFGSRSAPTPTVTVRMAAPRIEQLAAVPNGDKVAVTFEMPHGAQFVEYFIWGHKNMRTVLAKREDSTIEVETGSKIRARALTLLGGEPVFGKKSEDVHCDPALVTKAAPTRRMRAKKKGRKSKTVVGVAPIRATGGPADKAGHKKKAPAKKAQGAAPGSKDDVDTQEMLRITADTRPVQEQTKKKGKLVMPPARRAEAGNTDDPITRPEIAFTGEYSDDGDLIVATHVVSGRITPGAGLMFRVATHKRFKKRTPERLPKDGTFALDLTDSGDVVVEILSYRGSERTESVTVQLPNGALDGDDELDIDDEWFSEGQEG